ncbi:MAG: acyltransferase [Desulfovibrio sp.]|nr:acyltransferase [Desulfovibrio sp.]
MAREKLNSLQGIRAIAFMGIFASHTGLQYFTPTGSWGVSVFLVLSGFLMSYCYLDRGRITAVSFADNLKFSVGKLSKLYPLHLVMLAAAFPFMAYAFLKEPSVSEFFYNAAKIVADIFLLQTLVPKSDFYFSLNGVSWYLSVCLLVYFAFPYILKRMERYRGVKDAAIAIAVLFALQVVLGYLSSKITLPESISNGFCKWFVYIFPLSRLEDFLIGCNLGYIFVRTEAGNRSAAAWTLYELGALLLILGQWILYLHLMPPTEDVITVPRLWWLIVVQYTVSSCVLIWVFARNRGLISRVFSTNTLVTLGNLSSITFLIHEVTIRYIRTGAECLLESRLSTPEIWTIAAVIAFVITLLLSLAWQKLTTKPKTPKAA